MAAQTFTHDNITAKINRGIVPNMGVNIIDLKTNNTTEISLYKTRDDKTLFLDFNRFHDSRHDDDISENLRQIVITARQIAIEHQKHIVVSDKLRRLNKSLFNFINYNGLSLPMFFDELEKLQNTTGNDIELNLLPLREMNGLEVSYHLSVQRGQRKYPVEIKNIHIPERLKIKIHHQYINPQINLRLSESHNRYNNVNIDFKSDIGHKRISIAINKTNETILPPKLNMKKTFIVHSEIGARFPTYELFKELLKDKEPDFAYMHDQHFPGYDQKEYIKSIIRNPESLSDREIENIKGLIELVNYVVKEKISIASGDLFPYDIIIHPHYIGDFRHILKQRERMENTPF